MYNKSLYKNFAWKYFNLNIFVVVTFYKILIFSGIRGSFFSVFVTCLGTLRKEIFSFQDNLWQNWIIFVVVKELKIE